MSEEPEDGYRPALFLNTVKIAVAVALLSYVAANWLSHPAVDQPGLSRLVESTGGPAYDPVTTGSIGRSAANTRLDPCLRR